MKINSHIVKESGDRLDKYLANNEEISRSQIQKYIKNGDVMVNGAVQSAKYRLEKADVIKYNFSKPITDADTVTPQNIAIDIIFEDDDILIINKSAGMTVHPGKGNPDKTLANALAFHYPQLSDINGPKRPGIVHRLDQDTSGVMMIAKTNIAHMKLAEQFMNRTVKKMYFGITWGIWKDKEGIIDQPIIRKRSDPTAYIVNANGKAAQTEFKVIKETQYFSYVNYFPKTGRTHQLRVHSGFMEHPIIGDTKYSGSNTRGKGYIPEIAKKIGQLFKLINRQILHAQKISFIHPTKNSEVSFEANLPIDIKDIINMIATLNV